MKTKRVAAILAAGRGTRLAPHTDETPKCLLPIAKGKPILNYQLSSLAAAGISRIYITVGYRADQIRSYVATAFQSLDVVFVENHKFASTNTFYSLSLLSEEINQPSEVLQLNGDVVFDPHILTQLTDETREGVLVATTSNRCGAEEIKVAVNTSGAILQLNKQIDPTTALGEAVGVNRFSSNVWQTLRSLYLQNRETSAMEYFEVGIEMAIRQGVPVYPVLIGNYEAIEVDFQEDLYRARRLSFLHQ